MCCSELVCVTENILLNRIISETSLNQLYGGAELKNDDPATKKDADNMNSLEKILSKKLEELEPTLDLLGSDHRILQLANQDFANYLKFSSDSSRTGNADGNIVEETEPSMDEKAELESFLTVWIGMWLKKWKSRVKLIWGKESQESSSKVYETLSKAEPLWRELKCREEMIELVVSALIKNAEICGTEVIAEHLLKLELVKKNNQDINYPWHVIAVLNETLRKAREMAQNTGPLFLIKIDKGYFTRQLVRKTPEYEIKRIDGASS